MNAHEQLKVMADNCNMGTDDEQPIVALAERLLDAIDLACAKLSVCRDKEALVILARALEGTEREETK